MTPQPDPEQVLQSFTRLKTAFQEAADNSSGAAKPLFQKLSNTFNKMVAEGTRAAQINPDRDAIMKSMGPSIMELQMTMMQISRLAQTDPEVARAAKQLDAILRKELQTMMGNGNPGPNPQIRPRPKKPDSGDFDL